MGALMRAVYGTYPEYHTSADNLDFIQPRQLVGSLQMALRIVDTLEGNRRFLSRFPFGEPQLGRRGLYRTLAGHGNADVAQKAALWILAFADGKTSLLDIAERAGMDFFLLQATADVLWEQDLIQPVSNAETEQY